MSDLIQKAQCQKYHSKILPNNRFILNTIGLNYNLLNENEVIIYNQFKQHVDDFEKKHIYGSDYNGIIFPIEMKDILA